MSPSISVLIVTYNRSTLLSKAIASVFAQTYTDYEIVVVDDGSTDATEAVTKGFGDRVKYVRQENAGLAAGRNNGFRHAAGRWIALLDDDDLWRQDKLALQAARMAKLPEPAFIFCNGLRDGAPVRDPADPQGFVGSVRELRLPPSSWIFSRAAFETIGGFDESYNRIGEDISFLMRAYSRGIRPYYMDDPLVYWNSTPDSLSSSAMKRLLCQERILNEFDRFLRTDREHYFRYLYSLGKDAARLGDKQRARRYMFRAFALKPWKLELAVKCLSAIR